MKGACLTSYEGLNRLKESFPLKLVILVVSSWQYQSLISETELSKLVNITCQERGTGLLARLILSTLSKKVVIRWLSLFWHSCYPFTHDDLKKNKTKPKPTNKKNPKPPPQNTPLTLHSAFLKPYSFSPTIILKLLSLSPFSAPYFYNPHFCNNTDIQWPFHTTQSTAVIVILPLKTLWPYNPFLQVFNCFPLALD